MTPKIQEAIDNLVEALKTDSPDTAVLFEMTVNSISVDYNFKYKSHGIEKKSSGWSMRNLKGEWVK